MNPFRWCRRTLHRAREGKHLAHTREIVGEAGSRTQASLLSSGFFHHLILTWMVKRQVGGGAVFIHSADAYWALATFKAQVLGPWAALEGSASSREVQWTEVGVGQDAGRGRVVGESGRSGLSWVPRLSPPSWSSGVRLLQRPGWNTTPLLSTCCQSWSKMEPRTPGTAPVGPRTGSLARK